MSKEKKPKPQKPIVPICPVCNQNLIQCRCKNNDLQK